MDSWNVTEAKKLNMLANERVTKQIALARVNTIRAGMEAENKLREIKGESPAYGEAEFLQLLKDERFDQSQLRQIKITEPLPFRKKEEPTEEQKPRFMNHQDIADRYGIALSTLTRWKKNEAIGFPPPALCIRKTNFWREEDLDAWEAEHPEFFE